MKKSLVLAVIICLSGMMFAKSGFAFLRTEKSPVVISTAQTSYLFNNSVENIGYNPASSIGEDVFSARISYKMLDQDSDISQLASSYREVDHQYGLCISYLYISGIEAYDVPAEEPLYEFGSRNLIASFNYALKFQSGLKMGLTGKYLFEKIEFEDAYGFAGSLGLFREDNFIKGLNLGLAVNNVGTMSKLDTEETELPLDALFGIGYKHEFGFDMDMNIGNSVRYLINDEDIENFTGIELSYMKRFFIRSGYRANNEGTPFSLGIGLIFDNFAFDYSFTPFSDDEIDNSHAVSLSYKIK
ncbi:MAG: PorV/PorQ family protein [Candidatus Delongbacteria bacterium]|nr:PorV/PorQ family protein [Candidatus Delongbacteria bacterium]